MTLSTSTPKALASYLATLRRMRNCFWCLILTRLH